MSQTDAILSALKRGRKLTPYNALNQFRCFRLAARVRDLRERGHDIGSKIIEVGDKRVSLYWLKRAA